MFIEIQSNAKIESTKIYLLKSINRQFVNDVFDKLYKQERIKYINQSTFYEYPIFVIWRIVFGFNELKRKKRVIIDIKELNKIIIIDSYSMFLQFNITLFVIDCRYISVFDATEFFYQ